MSSSQTVKATESVKIKWGNKALGSSISFGGTQQYDHHYNDSWGYSDSAQAKTSQSTGIQVQKPASDLTKPYAFYTTAYVTDDGTIRVAYGVDLSYTVSDRWWSEFYAPPDLALNLPKHFYYVSNVVTPHWQPRTGDDRKEAHGLLFYASEKDPVTGEYPLLNGAAVDGSLVRIEVRVYNYSLLNTVPVGTEVCFDTAPIDPATLKEVKAERAADPQRLHCASRRPAAAGIGGRARRVGHHRLCRQHCGHKPRNTASTPCSTPTTRSPRSTRRKPRPPSSTGPRTAR